MHKHTAVWFYQRWVSWSHQFKKKKKKSYSRGLAKVCRVPAEWWIFEVVPGGNADISESPQRSAVQEVYSCLVGAGRFAALKALLSNTSFVTLCMSSKKIWLKQDIIRSGRRKRTEKYICTVNSPPLTCFHSEAFEFLHNTQSIKTNLTLKFTLHTKHLEKFSCF